MFKTLAMMTYLLGGAETQQLPMELMPAVTMAGSELPSDYTCQGKNLSIPVKWRHVPNGTRSLAIVMYDKTLTPRKYLWAVYDIYPEHHFLSSQSINAFRGEKVAKNSYGHLQYDGPCPPPGEAHHYVIKLYALKARFFFREPISTPELMTAMNHRVISTAKIELHVTNKKSQAHGLT